MCEVLPCRTCGAYIASTDVTIPFQQSHLHGFHSFFFSQWKLRSSDMTIELRASKQSYTDPVLDTVSSSADPELFSKAWHHSAETLHF